MVDDVVIIGAGGFGRTAAMIVEDMNDDVRNFNLIGFLDDAGVKGAAPIEALGFEYLGRVSELERLPVATRYVVALGSSNSRKRMAEKVARMSTSDPPILIHPTAYVARSSEVSPGSIVSLGATISHGSKVGPFSLLNINSAITHDCRAGAYTTLSPYACMLGGSETGEGAWLATRATLGVGCKLGAWSVLGASTTALNSVPDGRTALGTPARLVAHPGVQRT